MLKRTILTIGGLSLATGYYLQQEKVNLNNQYLKQILRFLHTQNPKYSLFIFKNMIRYSMINQNQFMKNFVFSQGFDLDGFYLPGLIEIGFDTVEIGPLSLIPSTTQQKRIHFGSKMALANISSFYQQLKTTPQKKIQTKIGVSITPNYEILKYAPYLIQQNILHCLKQFQQLNEGNQALFVHRYIIKLNQPQMKQIQTRQYLTMTKQLILNANAAVQQTLQSNKKIFSTDANLKKPQIFIQIPNQDQNLQLYNLVKSLPQVKHLIIDGAEYDVSKTIQKVKKKTIQNIQLSLGKRRINFQQLLDKVINESL